tara:strand:+ start:438 stop:596 length:159 start_codon:yes stop_codon:yes gene_type:complete
MTDKMNEETRERIEKRRRDERESKDIIPRHTGPDGCGKYLTECSCTSNALRK